MREAGFGVMVLSEERVFEVLWEFFRVMAWRKANQSGYADFWYVFFLALTGFSMQTEAFFMKSPFDFNFGSVC